MWSVALDGGDIERLMGEERGCIRLRWSGVIYLALETADSKPAASILAVGTELRFISIRGDGLDIRRNLRVDQDL